MVTEGETGLLVDERDVEKMAEHMLRLAREPELAASLGRAARQRIEANFTMDHTLSQLWAVISGCISKNSS